jgi:hypothetical protein
MPIQICPKCERLHYVPGACPAPRVPIATPITSPNGVSAIVHGDKPVRPETREALGKLVDAAVEKMAAKPARKAGRPKVHADRKAYKAQKERDRRAAKKAKP